MSETISVVIPNYNRKEELLRALQSALGQTVQPDEIIIVDDCSAFSVKEYLLTEGVLADARIQVIRNETNKGCGGSRNVGLRLAKGTYIALLDSDDYWTPDKLEKQLALFRRNPALDFVYCDTWVVKNGQNVKSGKRLIRENLWQELLNNWTPPNPSTLMVKRNTFVAMDYFDGELRHAEDFDFWLRAGLKGLKVDFCPERLSHFTFDAQDRMSFDFAGRMEKMEKFMTKWRAHFEQANDLKTYRKFYRSGMSFHHLDAFFFYLKRKDFTASGKIYLRHLWSNKRLYSILSNKVLSVVRLQS